MNFINTVKTGAAVLEALSSPVLAAPGQAQYTVPGGPGGFVPDYPGARHGTMQPAGKTKHCLAGVVIKAILGPYALPTGALNDAPLNHNSLRGLRNQLRSKGISANRLAEAQQAYDNGGNVKVVVASWYASASAGLNGGRVAQVNPKLLA